MASLELNGTEVYQGNNNGRFLSTTQENTVLCTYGMSPCVAVCGYSEVEKIVFLIHSDSTRDNGIGKTALIDGLRNLVSIGTGDGFTLKLFGGSVHGTEQYLTAQLPAARISVCAPEDIGSDSAYIAWNGVSATVKSRLARALGVDSVKIK
jgi:hypothetical protein